MRWLALWAVLAMATAAGLAQDIDAAAPEDATAEVAAPAEVQEMDQTPATAPASAPAPAEIVIAPATQAAIQPLKSVAMPATAPALTAVESAAQDEGPIKVSRPGTFEIHVQGADLRGVLQLLSTQGRKNIVATKEVTGTVTADLYGVTFDEALEAVLRSAGFVYVEKGNFIYVYTPKQLADMLKSEQKMLTRIFRLAYVPAADAKPLVEAALSPEGNVSITPAAVVGVGTSDSVTGGNSYALNDVLVVTDFEPFIQRAAEVVAEIDARPEQVLIEVTMLSATLNDSNALGVNFSTLAGVDWGGFSSDATFPIGKPPAPSDTGQIADNRMANWRTDFTTVSNGFTFGFMSNNIAAFITALESITDTTILANPKLLVVNKQRGEVLVGSRDGYLVTTVTEGQTTQSVQFLETGTRLVVRPFVGKDGFIRMEIHPEDSQGAVTVTEGLALPSETTTELTTNLMVRDGHTVVMGGLFREETATSRNQIPGLGSIPVLGNLFRYNRDSTERSEIIILLTPHIIRHEEDEAVSEQIKEDVERFRIGHRKGLRWWGRERLAQTNLRWARKSLAEGKTGLALWNIDLALSVQPRLMEAINLKEQITDKAIWADEPQDSPVNHLIEQMIMHELGRPVEEVIPPVKPRKISMIDPDVREPFGMEPKVEMPLRDRLAPMVAPPQRNGIESDWPDQPQSQVDGWEQPSADDAQVKQPAEEAQAAGGEQAEAGDVE